MDAIVQWLRDLLSLDENNNNNVDKKEEEQQQNAKVCKQYSLRFVIMLHLNSATG